MGQSGESDGRSICAGLAASLTLGVAAALLVGGVATLSAPTTHWACNTVVDTTASSVGLSWDGQRARERADASKLRRRPLTAEEISERGLGCSPDDPVSQPLDPGDWLSLGLLTVFVCGGLFVIERIPGAMRGR